MEEVLAQYGLFLAKTVTVVFLFAAVTAISVRAGRTISRGRSLGRLEVTSLNDKYRQMALTVKRGVMHRKAFAQVAKVERARRKSDRKSAHTARKRIFVMDFHGDIRASAVESLRQEITAALSVATPNDEILLRLDNAGGLIHEHGLAASQLQRIRERKISLTVSVDKIAASGGYMMACVADRIIAAPFAIVGSIGVLAEFPNFHRWMDQRGIDFEVLKAGARKRTLTLFGENTDEDRARMQQQLDDHHRIFKEFVAEHRPSIEIEKVATGEYWLATRAVELGLVDELGTSDDYLLAASETADIYEIMYLARQTLSKRLSHAVRLALDGLLGRSGTSSETAS